MGTKTTSGHADGGLWRRHGLSLVLLVLFVASLVGQVISGRSTENDERADAGLPPLTLVEYLRSPGFVSATFENW